MRQMKRSKSEDARPFSEVLGTGCQWIWLLMLYGIVIIALGSMVSKAFFAILLLPAVSYGIYRVVNRETLLPATFPYRGVWWLICGLGTILMMWIAYSVRVESLSWDWGKVIRSASEYVLTGDLQDKIYFARYPNNQFWYCVLVVVFKVVHWLAPAAELEQFYLVSIAMGCLMVSATIVLLHHIAGLLWNQKKAFVIGCMAWLCAPLYMWALYAYTDTAGMLLMMLLLYLYVKAYQSENMWQYGIYMGLFGLAGAAAYQVKVTVFILVLAAVIALILQRTSWKKALLGILALGIFFSLGSVTAKAGVSHVIPLEEEFCNQYEFPLTHWVMMSLDYGGYSQEDVDYTESFPSYEEKQKANIKVIKKRLKKKGFLGGLQFFCYNKQVRTWGDSTFAGCDYLSREPKNPDGFLERFVTTEGDMNWLCVFYTTLYYGLLLLGLLLSALGAVRRKSADQPLFVGRLTMIGITLFLTIWECNSRYLVVFLPLMILLSGEGYGELRRYLMERKEKRGEEAS